MINLAGRHISALPFESLKKISDLIWFDGPLLSHFKDRHNNDILFYWVDVDGAHNRWLIIKITESQFSGYIGGVTQLLSLVMNPVGGVCYSVDIDGKFLMENIIEVLIRELPSSYLPDEDVFYENDLSLS